MPTRSISPPLIMSQSPGRRKHESLLPPKNSPIYNPLKDLSTSKTKHPSASKSPKQLSVIMEEGPPRSPNSPVFTPPAFPSPKTLLSRAAQAEKLGCIYVPKETMDEIIGASLKVSKELRVWHGLDYSEQCLPMEGHKVYTNEQLEDFIDVFRRRLMKQKRALRPWEVGKSERECLLEELEKLREEQMNLTEEIEKGKEERKRRIKRKKGKMRRRRSVAKQDAVKVEWERRFGARQQSG